MALEPLGRRVVGAGGLAAELFDHLRGHFEIFRHGGGHHLGIADQDLVVRLRIPGALGLDDGHARRIEILEVAELHPGVFLGALRDHIEAVLSRTELDAAGVDGGGGLLHVVLPGTEKIERHTAGLDALGIDLGLPEDLHDDPEGLPQVQRRLNGAGRHENGGNDGPYAAFPSHHLHLRLRLKRSKPIER